MCSKYAQSLMKKSIWSSACVFLHSVMLSMKLKMSYSKTMVEVDHDPYPRPSLTNLLASILASMLAEETMTVCLLSTKMLEASAFASEQCGCVLPCRVGATADVCVFQAGSLVPQMNFHRIPPEVLRRLSSTFKWTNLTPSLSKPCETSLRERTRLRGLNLKTV